MPLVQKKIKAVYLWETKVRPSWFTPWANTVVYYPLTSTTTVNDMSWNNHTLTRKTSWCVFWTYWWVDCVYTYWNNSSSYRPPLYATLDNISQYTHTLNVWACKTGDNSWYASWYIFMMWTWSNSYKWWVEIIAWTTDYIDYAFWYDDMTTSWPYALNAWHNIVCIYDKPNSRQKLYVDWTFIWQRTTTYTHTINGSYQFALWSDAWNNDYNNFRWYISEFILENKEWTAQEVSDYYNATKATYWVS